MYFYASLQKLRCSIQVQVMRIVKDMAFGKKKKKKKKDPLAPI